MYDGNNDFYRLGFFGSAYTSQQGRQVSDVIAQTQSGLVVGRSNRYVNLSSRDPELPFGNDIWAVDLDWGDIRKLGISGGKYGGDNDVVQVT